MDHGKYMHTITILEHKKYYKRIPNDTKTKDVQENN